MGLVCNITDSKSNNQKLLLHALHCMLKIAADYRKHFYPKYYQTQWPTVTECSKVVVLRS